MGADKDHPSTERYRVSPQKAQVAQQQMSYLGYKITAGMWMLGPAWKEAICQTPEPRTSRELRTFLGMTGWCRLWIANYGITDNLCLTTV
ncbi:uncharacterized protein [Excalfactoria chinensis]|uniref:uncharacterized protein n=1 Tax=Excalfactoria chinensis TaxID=46218 RepID=UPI003B3B2A64